MYAGHSRTLEHQLNIRNLSEQRKISLRIDPLCSQGCQAVAGLQEEGVQKSM